MELPSLSKPSLAFTRIESLSSRNTSTDRLTSLPDRLPGSPFEQESLHPTGNLPSVPDQILIIQELTESYKQLTTNLSKYQNKSTPVSKCNHIRLTLLKFLRSEVELGLPLEMVSFPSHVHSQVQTCANQGITIFTKYWLLLLSELLKNWSGVSFVDKTCYLECISRLMARHEWAYHPSQAIFSDLLILTLNMIFKRLFNLKTLSLSLSAFIGKVFSYSYFHIPRFAPLLLFSLFVKTRTIRDFQNTTAGLSQITENSHHPEHLGSLVNYHGDFNLDDDTIDLQRNCMVPPEDSSFSIQIVDEEFQNDFPEIMEQHERLVIDLKDTNWVKRWAGFDSDVFRSFLKHFTETCLYYQQLQIDKDHSNEKVFRFIKSQPGGVIIYAHIMQIFESNFRMLQNYKKYQFKEQINPGNLKNEIVAFYSSGVRSNTKNYHAYLEGIPFLKFLNVLETLVYSSDCDSQRSLLLKYFESVLLMRAGEISPFKPDECDVMYDILLQLCLKLNNQPNMPFYLKTPDTAYRGYLLVHINWEFWIVGTIKMINTENMVSMAKALSFLFNLWDLIPSDYFFPRVSLDLFSDQLPEVSRELNWIIDRSYTLIYNLSMFLISDAVWEKTFIHWQPLIRHFFFRVVAFKIVGINNQDSAFNKIVMRNLDQTHNLLMSYYQQNQSDNPSLIKFETLPSMPILNKKLIITYFTTDHLVSPSSQGPLSNSKRSTSQVNILETFDQKRSSSNSRNRSYSSSTLLVPATVNTKKIYPYDIFDDAVYSTSVTNASQQAKSRSPSLTFGSTSPLPRSFNRSCSAKMAAPSSPQTGLSRVSSSSTLKKVPIISSALSFFKKVNDTINNEVKASGVASNTLSPPVVQTPRTSPRLGEPSSMSEISDEENFHNQLQNGQPPRWSPLLMPNVKGLLPMNSSPSSRVSSSSSLTSILSQPSSNTPITISGRSVSASSSGVPNSMESIPPPPELLLNIPHSKSFRYKYQLVFSDSFQNTFYHSKISQSSTKVSPANQVHGEPNSTEPTTNKKLFFGIEELVGEVDDILPAPPRLPLCMKPKNTGIGLLSSLIEKHQENELEEVEDQDILDMSTSKLSRWLSTSSSSSESSIKVPKRDVCDAILYRREPNLAKNWTLLGKVLNEWNLVVEEYERYLEVLDQDERSALNDNEYQQWLNDPFLVCDIPPLKSVFPDKDM